MQYKKYLIMAGVVLLTLYIVNNYLPSVRDMIFGE